METFLCSAILTSGADRIAVTDPHGWTLTIISVCVVFAALIVLCGIYSLSGGIFTGRFRRKSKGGDEEIAAAIAMALEAEEGYETEAAIAAALHMYLDDGTHDMEPGIITIKRRNNDNWKFSKR